MAKEERLALSFSETMVPLRWKTIPKLWYLPGIPSTKDALAEQRFLHAHGTEYT